MYIHTYSRFSFHLVGLFSQPYSTFIWLCLLIAGEALARPTYKYMSVYSQKTGYRLHFAWQYGPYIPGDTF
jgi:hypothetical protein